LTPGGPRGGQHGRGQAPVKELSAV